MLTVQAEVTLEVPNGSGKREVVAHGGAVQVSWTYTPTPIDQERPSGVMCLGGSSFPVSTYLIERGMPLTATSLHRTIRSGILGNLGAVKLEYADEFETPG